MKSKILFLLFSSFIFTALNAQIASDFVVSKELTENANAVVKEVNEIVDIKSSKKITYEVSKKIIVLNEKGNRIADAFLYYYNDYTIKNLEVKVYNLMGNEIKKIKKGDFKDVAPGDNMNLITEGRIKYADYTPTVYPYLLHFTYSYETSNTAFLPRWTPFENYNVSVENASIQIKNENQLELRKLEKNFAGYSIEKEENPTLIKYTLKNLLAQRSEPYGLSPDENFPKVYFALKDFHLKGYDGKANTWKELGEWFYEKLYKMQAELSPETVVKIQQLTANAKTDIEKAEIVYKYVQDKTRYVSIQLGIGGWQPMLAKDVDRLGYGDCKALTNYTHALLKAVGVTSYHTIIQSQRTKYGFDDDFPILQGNHMILHIPTDEPVWLECTSQKNNFGYIGRSNEDRNVLLITPEGGKITTTKKYTTEENLQNTVAFIDVDATGNAKANLQLEFFGSTIDYRTQVEYMTTKEKEDFYKENWDYHNGLKINTLAVSKNKDKQSWEEIFEFDIEKMAAILGNRMLLNLNVFNRDLTSPDKIRSRKQPVKIERGRIENDKIVFKIPSTYSVEALPENITITNKFGNYTAKVEQNNNELVYTRTLQINEGIYTKDEYNDFRDFIIEIIKNDNNKASLLTK
jgi:hypothetical protein